MQCGESRNAVPGLHPTCLRPASKRSQPGARRIQKNPIKALLSCNARVRYLHLNRPREPCSHGASRVLHQGGTMGRNLTGQNCCPYPARLGPEESSLASRARTHVPHPLRGPQRGHSRQQQGCELGTLVLDPHSALRHRRDALWVTAGKYRPHRGERRGALCGTLRQAREVTQCHERCLILCPERFLELSLAITLGESPVNLGGNPRGVGVLRGG